jgi:predicted nucleic acid-binding protein
MERPVITVDASTIIAALIKSGSGGDWARELLQQPMLAPAMIRAEVSHVLRQHQMRGELAATAASAAHADALDLKIGLVPYEVVATRIWELRMNITPYDAWYVATAEASASKLATLDKRLANSPGPRCSFLLPT